jgi:hypothetical protein
MKLNPAFASLMIDVPGSAPKYSKTKRISPQNASCIWDETFTFKIERSDLSAAQLRIRSLLLLLRWCLHTTLSVTC